MTKEEQLKKEEFRKEQEELNNTLHQQQDENDLHKVEKLEVLDI
jgi:hypothetical protein